MNISWAKFLEFGKLKTDLIICQSDPIIWKSDFFCYDHSTRSSVNWRTEPCRIAGFIVILLKFSCRVHADKLCYFMRFSSLTGSHTHSLTHTHLDRGVAWDNIKINARVKATNKAAPYVAVKVDLSCLFLWHSRGSAWSYPYPSSQEHYLCVAWVWRKY